MSLAALCLIFMGIGILMSPKMYNQQKKLQMERRLFLQTTISAVSMILLYAETFINLFEESKLYMCTSYAFWMLQYFPSMFIIFFITPHVRLEFFRFYFGGVMDRVKGSSNNSTTAQSGMYQNE